MEVKTFEGSTMREAINNLRASFGKDAVIVKTQEKVSPESGRKTFQVVAATSETGGTAAETHQSSQSGMVEVHRAIQGLEQKLEQMTKNLVRKDQLLVLSGNIDDVRHMLFEHMRRRDDIPFKSKNPHISKLLHYAYVLGVDESIVMKLSNYLESILRETNEDPMNADQAKSYAMRWFMRRTQIVPICSLGGQEKKVLVFCGKSGSGKSSIVAKLSAQIQKEHKLKPLVISFDRKVIGASEKLKLYGKILGLEYTSVETVDELLGLVGKSDDRPILIDTSGSARDQDLDDLSRLRELQSDLSYHLVVSLESKTAQIDSSIKSFSRLGIESLVFTKLDEVWSFGDILNLSTKWGIPLSVFSVGPNIPEDIEKASRERIVERLFGLDRGNDGKVGL